MNFLSVTLPIRNSQHRKAWATAWFKQTLFAASLILPFASISGCSPAETSRQVSPLPVPDPATDSQPPSDAALGVDASATDSPSVPRRVISQEEFFQAAGSGEIVTIQQAIGQGIDVNAGDPDGQTALMFAGFNGHLPVMRLLLDNGADVNQASSLNRTALMVTASGPYLQAVKMLLDAGAEVNVRDGQEGWTALMVAATEGHADVIKCLLEHGADKTLADVDEETALIFARNQGHTDVVELLTDQP